MIFETRSESRLVEARKTDSWSGFIQSPDKDPYASRSYSNDLTWVTDDLSLLNCSTIFTYCFFPLNLKLTFDFSIGFSSVRIFGSSYTSLLFFIHLTSSWSDSDSLASMHITICSLIIIIGDDYYYEFLGYDFIEQVFVMNISGDIL